MKHQPGCFGSVTCYEPESNECDGCPHLARCGAEVGRRLGGETQIFPSLRFFTPSLEDESLLGKHSKVPIRVQRELGRLQRKGLGIEQMRQSLRSGVNPLKRKKPDYLYMAFECLIAGTFDAEILRTHYLGTGVGEATARSQLAIVHSVFDILKVASRNGDTWRFNDSPVCP